MDFGFLNTKITSNNHEMTVATLLTGEEWGIWQVASLHTRIRQNQSWPDHIWNF